MATHESRLYQTTQGEVAGVKRQQHQRTIWLMTLMFLMVLAQPMVALAGPPDHAKAVFMRGEVSMVHIDEVIPEHSHFVYFLHPKGAANVEGVMEMIFDGEPPDHLRTGKKVKVKGRATKSKLWVSEVAALDGDGSSSTGSGNTVAAATTGDRKTITFVINMDGVDYAAEGASPYTQTHVDNSGKAMHDPVQFSVNSAYEEASFGQVTFSGSAASDVFLVSIPYDPEEKCAYYTIASNADAASPVNLNGYLHRLYVVPPKAISGCGWLALGQVGSYGSNTVRRSWSTRIDPIAFAHELGHNIGWHHAATDPDNDGTKNVEYGDTSDLMGYCCAKRKLNSVHVDQVGWFDHSSLRDKVVDVTSPGEYSIAPLGSDPGSSTYPQILKITPATGRPYYLSYRQRTGMDAGMSSTYTTGVNIHRGEKSNNWSYLVKVLKTNITDPSVSEFHDPENSLTISQVTNNDNFVTIDVSFGGECVVGDTQVSLSPSSQEVSSLTQSPSYTVTIANNDSVECGETNYQVSLVSVKDALGNVEPNISGTVQDPSVMVGPQGQSSTTVTLGLGDVENGMYTMAVDVSEQNAAEPMHSQQATGSVNVNVAVCEIGQPAVTVQPNAQVLTYVGQLVPYNVTVTNNDSTACQPTNWSVGLTSSLSGVVTDPVLTVGPGQSATTDINMNVDGADDGLYPMTVTVADPGSTAHSNQVAQASLELKLKTCVMGAPTVQLTPNQQMVSQANDLRAYQLTVTNHDNAFCQASLWSVAVSSGLGSSVVNPQLTIVPGANGVTMINMEIAGAADGTYPMTVTVSDGNPAHDGMATGTLSMDLNAPTTPSGVTAQLTGKGRNKSVQVSWNQASDGSGGTGVASYVVYRNGVRLSSTTSTNYKDSNFSTTIDNVYEVYAVDQVGHVSATAGTVTYTYSGGNKGGGNGGGKGKKK